MKRNSTIAGLLDDVTDESHRAVLETASMNIAGGLDTGLDLRFGGPNDAWGNGVCTPMGDEVVAALSRWLGKGSRISFLYLDGHPLGDSSLRVLLQGVARNEHLDHLSLRDTGITDAEPLVELLQDGSSSNNSLTRISLQGSPASAHLDAMSALGWHLLENKQPLRLKYILRKLAVLLGYPQAGANTPQGSTSSLSWHPRHHAAALQRQGSGTAGREGHDKEGKDPGGVQGEGPPEGGAAACCSGGEGGGTPRRRRSLSRWRDSLDVLDLDDRGGAHRYTDTSLRFVVAVLVGCHPAALSGGDIPQGGADSPAGAPGGAGKKGGEQDGWAHRVGNAPAAAGQLPADCIAPLKDPRARLVSANTFITTLILSNSALTAAGAKLLSSYLPLDTCLKKIDLANSTGLGSTGVTLIAKSLTLPGGNTSVEQLDLSRTGCSGEKCGAVIAKMITSHEKLGVLRLRGNSFAQCGGMFVKAQYVNTNLRVFDLEECQIPERFLEEAKESELLHETPQCLIVSVPKLHADSPAVVHLDCSVNLDSDSAITDKSLLLLLESLHGNTCLEYLNLSGNAITFAGLSSLTACLSKERCAVGLHTVVLRGLRFAPETVQQMESSTRPVKKMCDAIRAHPCLSRVDLSSNYIEEGAADEAFLCAKQCLRLTYLGFDGTDMPEETKRRLSQLLPLHRYPEPFARLAVALWDSGVAEGVLDFSSSGPWWEGYALAPCEERGVQSFPKHCDDMAGIDLSMTASGLATPTLLEGQYPQGGDASRQRHNSDPSSPFADVGDHLNGSAFSTECSFRDRQGCKRVEQESGATVKRKRDENPNLLPEEYDVGYSGRSREAQISDAMSILCEVVEDEKEVTVVDLSGHHLGDAGVLPWVKLLSKGNHLVGLHLSDTQMTNRSAFKLVQAIREKHAIRIAAIDRNPRVSSSVTAAVASYLKYNSTPAALKQLFVNIRLNLLENVIFKGDELQDEKDLTDEWLKCIVDTIIASTTPDPEEESAVREDAPMRGSLSQRLLPGRGAVADGLTESRLEPVKIESAVRRIDVSHTCITTTSLQWLTVLLKDPHASANLTHIILRNCMISGTQHLVTFLDVAAMRSVRLVDLSHNYLGVAGFKAISSAMQRHVTLGEVLLIGDEMIDSEKHSEVNRQLRLGKELNRHPGFKKSMARIKNGDLTVTSITVRGATHHLARLLGTVVHLAMKLTLVDLSHGEMDDRGAGCLAKALNVEPLIDTLKLSHNCITTVGARCLASSVETSHILKVLWLDHNDIDGRGVPAFLSALEKNTSLVDLRMEDNPKIPSVLLEELNDNVINDQPYLKSVLPRIREGDDALTSIDLSDQICTDLSLRRLVQVVPGTIVIHTINISNSVITNEGAGLVAYLITSYLTMRILLCDSCGIDDTKATYLFKAVRQNQGLQRLSLKNNQITREPLADLMDSIDIQGCGTLYEVDLEGNPCMLKGGGVLTELAKTLEFNSVPVSLKQALADIRGETVRDVILRGAGPSDEQKETHSRAGSAGASRPELHSDKTAVILASAFPPSKSVRTVDLSYNAITNTGASALAECLLESPQIISLNLRGNSISDAGVRALRTSLLSCTTVKRIDLAANIFCDSRTTNELALLLECNAHPPQLKNYVVGGMKGDSFPEIAIDGAECEAGFEAAHRNVIETVRAFEAEVTSAAAADEEAPPGHDGAPTAAAGLCGMEAAPEAAAEGGAAKGKPSSVESYKQAHGIPELHPVLVDRSVALLCTFLAEDPEVQSVVLPNNRITAVGAASLVSAVAGLSALKRLDLRGNLIGDAGGILLCKLARERPDLEAIDLASNLCTDVTALQFIKHLKRGDVRLNVNLRGNPGISSARMSDLDLLLTLNHKSGEMKQLVTALLAGDEWIREVDLQCKSAQDFFDDRRGFQYTQDSLEFLLGFLAGCPSVRAIDLSRNGMRDVDVLNTYMQNAMSLRTFTLNDTPGIAEKISRLFVTLRHSVNLTVVNFLGCRLDDSCADDICSVIGVNFTLVTLNLGENNLTDVTARKVVDAANNADDLYDLQHVYLTPSSADIDASLLNGACKLALKPPVETAS